MLEAVYLICLMRCSSLVVMLYFGYGTYFLVINPDA